MTNKSGVSEQKISLPKGGGELKGLGEKFQPDLHTGTGNFSIPIAIPPGRNGFQPTLSLNYSTGSPNGPFGLGWSLGIPSVTRKTSKGIPKYNDKFNENGNPIWHPEEDIFVLSGAEDLVHIGEGMYRPRTEGLFARIEKVSSPDGQPCWVVTTKNGIRNVYGKNTNSRLSVEENGVNRIFQWVLTESEDTCGNKISYKYKFDTGVDLQSDPEKYLEERNHNYNQLYVEKVEYVNYKEDTSIDEKFLWMIEFDYGEFDDHGNGQIKSWETRPDRFSSYRAGFEIRIARRCKRMLIKRTLEDSIENSYDLIKSYDLTYQQDEFSNISLLKDVTLRGYKGEEIESFPPISFEYTNFEPQSRKYENFSAISDYLPEKSLNDPNYEIIDLFGNGLPSIVHSSTSGWRYWRNLGSNQFAFPTTMKYSPAGVLLADDGVQFADMNGDGSVDLLVTTGSTRGYYGKDDKKGEWTRFHHYHQAPSFNLKDLNTKLVDVDGDGVIDVLSTFDHHFLFIRNGNHTNELRFEGPIALERKHNLDEWPDVYFNSLDKRIHLADMSGDGLQDMVLVHSGRVDYWPNMGYGKFGKRITIHNSPRFQFNFDPKRLFLADINGDGLADMLYVGFGELHLWINQNGNCWSKEIYIHGTPVITDKDSVRIVDMKGTGNAGLLYTYDYSLFYSDTNYKYLDLTGGVKPLLLSEISNNIGVITKVKYRSSTEFYISDTEAGRPWKTTLPFPVQVVSEVTTEDAVTKSSNDDGLLLAEHKITTRYTYHHGHYDGIEREFRGFGRVDQFDTEDLINGNDKMSPMCTITWFHQGIQIDFSDEYRQDSMIPLTSHESITDPDGLRALRGSILRTEIYGLDGTQKENKPYTFSEGSYSVDRLFQSDNKDSVWFPKLIETRTVYYEREDEPRIQRTKYGHDNYGNVIEEENIGFGRAAGIEPYSQLQSQTLRVVTKTSYRELNLYNNGPLDDPYKPSYIVDRPGIVEILGGSKESEELLGKTLYFYDGEDFHGIGYPDAENSTVNMWVTHGVLMCIMTLAFTDKILNAAYVNHEEVQNILSDNKHGYYHKDDNFWIHTFRSAYRRTGGRYEYGLVSTSRDPRNNDTHIDYDHFLLFPVRLIDPVGFPTQAEYDYSISTVKHTVNSNSNHTVYEYDPLGRLKSVAIMGKIRESDATGLPIDVEGDLPDYPTLVHEYDMEFQLSPSLKPVHVVTKQREQKRKPDLTEDNFFVTYDYYDGFGRCIQSRVETEDGPLNPLANPLEPSVQNRWVVSGWKVCNNKGLVVRKYQRRFANDYEFVFDSRLTQTPFFKFSYDPLGRMVNSVNCDGTLQRISYSPWDATIYDENDTSRELDLSDPVISTRYNALLTDPNSYLKTHFNTPRKDHYDAWGRLIAVEENNGWWDVAGNQVIEGTLGATNQLYITRYQYDLLGRLLRIYDARNKILNPTLEHVFDLRGNKLMIHHRPAAGRHEYVYDAAGNLIWSKDARGVELDTSYDELNRPLEVKERIQIMQKLREKYIYRNWDPNDTTAHQEAQERNLYGSVEAVYDQAGKLQFSYDYQGKVKEKTRWIWDDQWDNQSVEFWTDSENWDRTIPLLPESHSVPDDSRLSSRLTDQPNGFTFNYRYDVMGRLLETHYPDGTNIKQVYNKGTILEQIMIQKPGSSTEEIIIQSLSYNEEGQRLQVQYGNNIVTDYVFDEITLLLRRIRTGNESKKYQDLSFFYDPMKNIVKIDDLIPYRSSEYYPNSRYFHYDPLYRLILANGWKYKDLPSDLDFPPDNIPSSNVLPHPASDADMIAYTHYYLYDEVGNFRRNDDYTYDKTIRYKGGERIDLFAGEERIAVEDEASDVGSYRYDENGNTTHSPSHGILDWDYANRLIYAETKGNIQSRYFYDITGNRIMKVVKKDALMSLTLYIDEKIEVYYEKHADSNITTKILKHISDGSEQLVTIDSDAEDEKLTRLFYHGDHLGSVHVVTDNEGNFYDQEEYLPFGLVSDRRVTRNKYLFNGKEMDYDLELYYYNSRYFSPKIGRFVNPDRVMPNLKIPHLFNRYQYAHNSPVRYFDPTGYWGEDMHFAAVYVAGRFAGADHPTALRVAIASQILDDYFATKAPQQKATAVVERLIGEGNILGGCLLGGILIFEDSVNRMRKANGAHALGVTVSESERVAQLGISDRNPELFGLGLHTVGDLPPHRCLYGPSCFGHQNWFNENNTISTGVTTAADKTHNNPQKALDTIGHFYRLWGEYLHVNLRPLNPVDADWFRRFVNAETEKEKTALLQEPGFEEIHWVMTYMHSEQLRKSYWEHQPGSGEALKKAYDVFFEIGSPFLFRPSGEKLPSTNEFQNATK